MKKHIIIIFTVLSLLILNSCKRKFDLPPKKAEVANSGSITIDSIYKQFGAHYSLSPTKLFKFNTDVTLTCTVTADEVSGNLYKTVYVKDETGTLQLKLLNAGGLYVGDQIRVNLNGVILDDYGKMIQLDSLDIEKKVTKINSGNVVTPIKTTYNELNKLMQYGPLFSYSVSILQGALITLDSVEFDVGSKNFPYADKVNLSSIDRDLVTPNNKFIVVRSSGYSNFANSLIPNGKGKITAIVSQYNGAIQLIIRDIKEIQLAAAPAPYFSKNYDDINLLSGGWTTQNVIGANYWTVGTINGTYANASNYVGGSNYTCECWLISPSVDLSITSNPALTFKSATKYSGPTLQTYISTNYVSGSPSSATWVALNPTLSGGNFDWTRSGYISLNAYKSSNVHVAFKYTGTNSAGATWEIDNIGIIEN
ncbi:MAG: DUF5689 domain-containing protein [Bacteroidota bacterium]|nr:DUF5689 domain-containing protein [Bacteroidota bacterium]